MSRPTAYDTIAALATPPGSGALAVVRLSGNDAHVIADRVFRGRRALADLQGFEGAMGTAHGADGPVDEVVAWVYRGPRSFTGEDMVEFSCHGGAVSARLLLAALLEAGARPADPGAFTRRAFLNGRVDLSQAEAVAELIAARGRRAHDLALAQLQGGLSRRVEAHAAEIREMLARIEAHLDFGDDVPEAPDTKRLVNSLDKTKRKLERLAASHAPSRRLREGMIITLAGRPNVGKSSLMNALLGFDRALVHESPGTTRDVVDVTVEWAGIPVRLVDTAGLREAVEPLEAEGIERSRREVVQADRVLWVVDATAEATGEDHAIAGDLDFDRVHLVLNKSDLGRVDGGWVNGHSPRGLHVASAKTGEGLAALVAALEEEISGELGAETEAETVWVSSERHAYELNQARTALERAVVVLTEGHPLELGAADLHRSLEALAAITGDRAGEDLLDTIFSRFCIGK